VVNHRTLTQRAPLKPNTKKPPGIVQIAHHNNPVKSIKQSFPAIMAIITDLPNGFIHANNKNAPSGLWKRSMFIYSATF
jgi:hypothetical protein